MIAKIVLVALLALHSSAAPIPTAVVEIVGFPDEFTDNHAADVPDEKAGGLLAATGHHAAAAVTMASNDHPVAAVNQLSQISDEKRGGLLLAATGHHAAAAVVLAHNGHPVAAVDQALRGVRRLDSYAVGTEAAFPGEAAASPDEAAASPAEKGGVLNRGLLLGATDHHAAAAVTMASNEHPLTAIRQVSKGRHL